MMEQSSKKKDQPKDSEKYAMDLGIVSISKVSSNEHRMHLPVSASVDPCEGKIEEKLKRVLDFKTLNKTMVQLLRPSVSDRSILTPQKFRLKVNQVCDVFSNMLDTEGETYPYRELFEDIIELLKHEEEKGDLLDEYRHMLLMG
jgi:hypothetical protein